MFFSTHCSHCFAHCSQGWGGGEFVVLVSSQQPSFGGPTQSVLPLAMLPMVDWAIPPDRCQWCQRLSANATLEDSLGVINKCPRCLQQRKAAVALELKPKASPSSSPLKLKPKAAPSSSPPSKKEGGGIKLKLQPHHGVFSVSVLKPMKGPLHPPLPPPTAKHPNGSKR